ncbi:MAG: 1-acyl-sn-glycerol-3-phosphate acyltransferase [Spirochaetales bacterium]|nr:1-acyl-sn-glycerol-3-phosphate acyltransferase [Leptospiraceae bacterium]MCP5483830.1 1-acyl-sn-glycerol-3-phosphate acyltransferase [Spirochaetales bacterium]
MDRLHRLHILHALLNSIVAMRVQGIANMPSSGGAVVVCNHTDLIDAVVQGLYSGRDLSFLAKAELFDESWLERLRQFRVEAEKAGIPPDLISLLDDGVELSSQLLEDIHVLPIIRGYRSGGAAGSVKYYDTILQNVKGILSAGRVLAVYPEGTRSRTGRLGPFRGFAARAAIAAGVPIVPTAILGAHGFSDLNRWVSGENRDLVITYRIGEPVYPQDFPKEPGKRGIRLLTREVHKRVSALIEEGNEHARKVERAMTEAVFAAGRRDAEPENA